MEMARVIGRKMEAGWRPRRSIIFASWASEEAGIMGSTEWVMDKIHKLTNRAVGHVNLDLCTAGDILDLAVSPSLKPVAIKALKGVKSVNPEDMRHSIWWMKL